MSLGGMPAALVIAPPTLAQWPACRRLLPAAFARHGRAPELLVANGPEGMRGVLAQAWTAGGFAILLEILPPWRRRGIGRALVAQAVAQARGETPALRSWSAVAQGSDADAFLRACGFVPARRLLVFETDGVRYGELSTLLRRAGRRRTEKLLLQPLQSPSVAPGAVARLVAGGFGMTCESMAAMLDPDHPDPYDGKLSQVLMCDGEPVGAILGRRYGKIIEVDVNLVIPALRHGVGNLMLLEAISRLSREAGIGLFRFMCEAHVRDTIKLGARANAARQPDRLWYALPMPAGTECARRPAG